jgi:hypothetical protein
MNAVNFAISLVPETGSPNALDTELARIARRLTEPRQDIEQAFLDMGLELLGSVGLLGELSAAHEGMPGELESEEFNAAATTLASIRDEVLHMAAAHTGEDGRLERLAVMARAVSAPLDDLRKAVRTIRLVAVNARIAAAAISGAQGELGAFTTDMMDLGQRVADTVTIFAEAYESFASALADARSANAAFSGRHGATMAKISARLAEHLGHVDVHRERARTKAREQSALTAHIRSRIGLAVSALQIGDITRQRVEHVEEALAMLADYRDGGPAGDNPKKDNTIAAGCQLAVAQLDDASGDFEHQILDLSLALDQLAADAENMVDAGTREAAAALSDGDTALGAMIDDLGKIRTLFRDFARTRESIEDIAGEVARSVAEMVAHLGAIEEIEHHIRLLSLNTAIQCGRIGEDGRALRMIAQDLRDIATGTVAASSAILAALDGAAELARALVQGNVSDPGRRIIGLEADAGTATDLLGAVSARLRGHAGTVAAVGPRVARQLQTAAGSAGGRRDLSENWRSVRPDILALSTSGADDFALSMIDEEFFARLRARYTMDAERQIHDALLGYPPGSDAPPTDSEQDADLDDIFL